MIKTIRRGAAALLAAIVLTGSLTGCGTWSNTKIVLTTGLTGSTDEIIETYETP